MGSLKILITKDEAGLVRRIATDVYSKYCPAGSSGNITKEDLYHFGIIGLLEAKKKFDKSRKVPWLAFAAFRVRGEMLDNLRKLPEIRIPHEKQKMFKDLESTKLQLLHEGKDCGAEALSQKLGWTLDEVHKVQNLRPVLRSASATDERGDDETSCQPEIIIQDNNAGPEKIVMCRELVQLAKKCLQTLTALNRLIFTSRVLEEVKLRELASTMNCSAESVRQRQKTSEAKMKKCFEDNGWTADNYLEVIQ